MIHILPAADGVLETLRADCGNAQAEGMMLLDGNRPAGRAAYVRQEDRLRLLLVEAEDAGQEDGLLRAVLNTGLQQGAVFAEVTASLAEKLPSWREFVKLDKDCAGRIRDFFTLCAGSCGKSGCHFS
jgi:hypothetical protein